MADTSNIRKFADAADYTKNFIVQSEIDRFLPGGKHFIDEDFINRTIAEASSREVDPVRIREIIAKSESTCETLLPEETAALMQVTDKEKAAGVIDALREFESLMNVSVNSILEEWLEDTEGNKVSERPVIRFTVKCEYYPLYENVEE